LPQEYEERMLIQVNSQSRSNDRNIDITIICEREYDLYRKRTVDQKNVSGPLHE